MPLLQGINAVQTAPNIGAVTGSTIPGMGRAAVVPGMGTSTAPGATAPGARGAYTGPLAGVQVAGEPFAVLLGGVLLLVGLKALTESSMIPGDPGQIRIGGASVMTIGVTAAVFIVAFKALANRYPIPGVYQFANAI